MPKVIYDTAQGKKSVNFSTMPSQADIDEVAKQFQPAQSTPEVPEPKGVPGYAGAALGFVKGGAQKPALAASLGDWLGKKSSEKFEGTKLQQLGQEVIFKPLVKKFGLTKENISPYAEALESGYKKPLKTFETVGTAEKIGAFGENVAEMALTGGMASPAIAGRAAQVASKVAPLFGKLAGRGASLVTRALGEGALAAGQTVAQTGDLKDAKLSAGIGASLPVVGAGLRFAKPMLGSSSRFAVSQATGLSPDTVKMAVKTDLSKAGQEVSRETIGDQVKGAFEKRMEDLGSLGKEYEGIRKQPTVAPFNLKNGIHENVQTVLDRFGISVSPEGKIAVTNKARASLNKSEKEALQSFIDTYSRDPALTSDTFLNTRHAADQIINYSNSTTSELDKVAKAIRGSYDEIGKKQFSGLKELDAQFAPEVEFLGEIKKDLFNNDGSLKDGAYSKLASLTNKANIKRLERLEQVVPGITERVNILKALEDIEVSSGNKVGTYLRGGIAGALAGGGLNPITAVIGAIAAHPENAVRILRTAGTISESTIAKILSGKTLSAFERMQVSQVFKSFVQQSARSQRTE